MLLYLAADAKDGDTLEAARCILESLIPWFGIHG